MIYNLGEPERAQPCRSEPPLLLASLSKSVARPEPGGRHDHAKQSSGTVMRQTATARAMQLRDGIVVGQRLAARGRPVNALQKAAAHLSFVEAFGSLGSSRNHRNPRDTVRVAR